MWTLSILQLFSLGFGDAPIFIVDGMIPVVIMTAGIIRLARNINNAFKKLKEGIKPEILEDELPAGYKIRIQLGYTAIISLFSSQALSVVFHEINFKGNNWVLLLVILLFLGFPLALYSSY